MRYLKTYESLNEPEIGDYVILDPTHFNWLKNRVKNEIGKISNITNDDTKEYKIMYEENIENGPNAVLAYREEIIDFSKNRKDLEPYIAAIKFNL